MGDEPGLNDPGLDDLESPRPRRPRRAEGKATSAPRATPKSAKSQGAEPMEAVPKGWLRGRLRDVAYETEPTARGVATIWTFVIQLPKPGPAITVVMRGLTISHRIKNGEWLQVECAEATDRPIHAERMYLPHTRAWVRTFELSELSVRQRFLGKVNGVMAVVVPIMLILGVVGLLRYFTHVLD